MVRRCNPVLAGAFGLVTALLAAQALAAPDRAPSPSDRAGPATLLEASPDRTLLRLGKKKHHRVVFR